MTDYAPYNRKTDLDGSDGPLAMVERQLRALVKRDDFDASHLARLRAIVDEAQVVTGTAMKVAHNGGESWAEIGGALGIADTSARDLANRWTSKR